MEVCLNIKDEYKKYLEKIDLNTYINDLIAKDIYLNSEKFIKDKKIFKERLKSALNNNTISHKELWDKIDENCI